MHVIAFAAATRAVLQDDGGVTAHGFPMTSARVDVFPQRVTVPLVLSVYAHAGGDFEPHRYIAATSPEGERVGDLNVTWEWPDNANVPVKYRVFVYYLAFTVNSPGVYKIGLYDGPDATETDNLFPLTVTRTNPLLSVPPRQ
jgi:hypothetical protein